MENLAYLRYAAYVDAPFTYKNQKDIWNGGDQNFWLAFGVDGKGEQVKEWPDETWYQTALLIFTWAKLKKIHADFAKDRKKSSSKNINLESSAKPVNPESKYLGVLARYIVALAFNLMLHRKNEGDFFSFKDLLTKDIQENLKKVEQTALKVVRRAVKSELEDSEKWKSVANPRLNMPQDDETWTKLKNKVIHDFNSEVEDDYSF